MISMKGDDMVNSDSESLKAYYKDVRKVCVLDSSEQTELAIKAKNGDVVALKKLVESNLRFVLKIAREYSYTGLPLGDLIQEGNLGMIKAISRFDETRGFNFISYAVWWIRQSIIQSAYDNGNSVRIPVNRINAVNKVVKAGESLLKELGREPSVGEIHEYYLEVDGASAMSEKEISSALIDSGFEVSLSSTYSDKSGTELHENLVGDGLIEMEGAMNKSSLQYEVEGVLCDLTNRESDILRMYFGIGEHSEMTLSEIGEKINLTNERVRQIKEFALKKLRTFNNSTRLKEFLDCEIR